MNVTYSLLALNDCAALHWEHTQIGSETYVWLNKEEVRKRIQKNNHLSLERYSELSLQSNGYSCRGVPCAHHVSVSSQEGGRNPNVLQHVLQVSISSSNN